MKALIEEGEQEIGIKMQGLALAEGNLYHPFFLFKLPFHNVVTLFNILDREKLILSQI